MYEERDEYDTIDNFSTRFKAIWLTARSASVCCSCAVLSLFTVALRLYLTRRPPGEIDAECVFKYLQIAGAAFSLSWHLFQMILVGSGTFNRIPKWFHLALEIGSGILLGVMGFVSFAEDRKDRPPDFKEGKGEGGIKTGAITILTITCLTHLGFFIFGVLSKPTPVQPDTHRSQSCDGCVSLNTLRKEHTMTTTRSAPTSDSRGASQTQLPVEQPVPSVPAGPPVNTMTSAIPSDEAPAYTRGDYQGEELAMFHMRPQQRPLSSTSEAPVIIAAPTAEMLRMAPAGIRQRTEGKQNGQRNSRLFGAEGSDHDNMLQSDGGLIDPPSPVSPLAQLPSSSHNLNGPSAHDVSNLDLRWLSLSKEPPAT